MVEMLIYKVNVIMEIYAKFCLVNLSELFCLDQPLEKLDFTQKTIPVNVDGTKRQDYCLLYFEATTQKFHRNSIHEAPFEYKH